MAARDYKSRANPAQRNKKQQKPGWVWFVAGLLVGLFVASLVWLKVTPSGPAFPRQATVTKQKGAKPEVAESKEKGEPETPKPRFDFYTILPEMEVIVPDPADEPEPETSAATTAEDSPPVKRAAAESASYMLQMGSFRRYVDADRLKASLALVGIQAEIQRVSIKDGDVYHRVRSGPYNRAEVNRLRSKLQQNKISSLVIKYRK
jgi:cell division protein FtsN